MSVEAVLQKAIDTIEKMRMDAVTGVAAAVSDLGEHFKGLSRSFLDSRDITIHSTVEVIGATQGKSADAFEHLAHAHNGAMFKHSKAALRAKEQADLYADAVEKANHQFAELEGQARTLLLQHQSDKTTTIEIAPMVDRSRELIQKARQLVVAAGLVEKGLENQAEHYGERLVGLASSLKLPVGRRRGLAFTGGYEVTPAPKDADAHTIRVHLGTVWRNGKKWTAASEDVSRHMRYFGNSVGINADAFGRSKAGRIFAKAVRSAVLEFTSAGNDAAEQTAYIGHGLAGMVIRHNRNEEENLIEMAKLKQRSHPDEIRPPISRPEGKKWADVFEGAIAGGVAGVSSRPPVPLSDGTGGGGDRPNDRDRYVPDEHHGPTEPATSGSRPYVPNPDVGHSPTIKNPDPRPVLGDPLGRAFGKLWETPSPAAP